MPLYLTGIRETHVSTFGRKKLRAWVAHHQCGWSTGFLVATGKKPKDITETMMWQRANKLLTLHKRYCK